MEGGNEGAFRGGLDVDAVPGHASSHGQGLVIDAEQADHIAKVVGYSLPGLDRRRVLTY
jgi:hypothetical protein